MYVHKSRFLVIHHGLLLVLYMSSCAGVHFIFGWNIKPWLTQPYAFVIGPTKNSVTWQEGPHRAQKGGVNQIFTANNVLLKLAFL